MGYDIDVDGHIEFASPEAIAKALAAINADSTIAGTPFATMHDALTDVFSEHSVHPDGDHGFAINGFCRYHDTLDAVTGAIAPHVTAGSAIEYVGEDGSFWRETYTGSVLVSQDGMRTYINHETGLTEEHQQGVTDALASVETVLINQLGEDAEGLMHAIRTHIHDALGQQAGDTEED